MKNTVNNPKPTLVFLHYFGGSAESWKWVIDFLTPDYECVALNLPGFGNESPLENISVSALAENIQLRIDHLKIKKCVIVAHSMSAKIALKMVADDKKSIFEKIILVAPTPPGIEPIEEKEKQRMLRHPYRDEAETTVEKISKLPLSTEKYKLAVENNFQVDPETWNWWLNEGMDFSIEDEIKNFKIPVLIFYSEGDPVITPKLIQKKVLPFFPNATLFKTEKSGHLLPLEVPHWLSDQIKNII